MSLIMTRYPLNMRLGPIVSTVWDQSRKPDTSAFRFQDTPSDSLNRTGLMCPVTHRHTCASRVHRRLTDFLCLTRSTRRRVKCRGAHWGNQHTPWAPLKLQSFLARNHTLDLPSQESQDSKNPYPARLKYREPFLDHDLSAITMASPNPLLDPVYLGLHSLSQSNAEAADSKPVRHYPLNVPQIG